MAEYLATRRSVSGSVAEDESVLRRAFIALLLFFASNQISNELKPHSIGRTIVCLLAPLSNPGISDD
jgi:hypothetical protein